MMNFLRLIIYLQLRRSTPYRPFSSGTSCTHSDAKEILKKSNDRHKITASVDSKSSSVLDSPKRNASEIDTVKKAIFMPLPKFEELETTFLPGKIDEKEASRLYDVLLKNLQDIQQFNPTPEQKKNSWELETYYPLKRAIQAIFNVESNNIVLSQEQKNEIRPLLLNVVEQLSLQLARYEYGPKSYYVHKKLTAKLLIHMLKTLDIEELKLEIILNHIYDSMKFLDWYIEYTSMDDEYSDCE